MRLIHLLVESCKNSCKRIFPNTFR